MSGMHVIDGDGDNGWKVVMHFPLTGTNDVSLTYSTALINSGLGGTSVLAVGAEADGKITQAELDTIVAGTVVEHVATLLAETGGTSNAELKATLLASFNSEQTRVINNLKRRLRYYSFIHNAP